MPEWVSELGTQKGRQHDQPAITRHYPRGLLIPTTPDQLLQVVEGVVAQKVIYVDGTEVLLGFYGPNQLLVPHPIDSCYIHFQAHTDVALHVLLWAEAHQLPVLSEQLRTRIWQLEAWAALQARPATESAFWATR